MHLVVSGKTSREGYWPETEALLAAFSEGRVAAQERLKLITEKIQEQARLNKALRLNRVPRVVARVLRELDRAGLHDSFTVIGTQALYAYEAAGGAHFLWNYWPLGMSTCATMRGKK